DHPMCGAAVNPRLIVGAYDDTGMLADFTNFGRCVDVVAPGFHIITPIPGGWYLPLSGTSFSAPLTVRLVSIDPLPSPFTPEGAHDIVFIMRDGQQRLPLNRFPRELLYDPQRVANQWALKIT